MTIYVVFGTTGEYSDRSEWLVKAFRDKESAQELVVNATEYADVIFSKTENKELDKYSDEFYKLVESSPYDPKMSMDYTGTSYYYEEVELV